MFRFHKTQDVLTLFHSPKVAASTRVLNLLKQANAQAFETATEDQASDHTPQNKAQRPEFQLDIEEGIPTQDQFRTIMDYLGTSAKATEIIKGASGTEDAMKKLSETTFQRPLLVDWNNGKVVAGEKESEILKLVKELPKETDSV